MINKNNRTPHMYQQSDDNDYKMSAHTVDADNGLTHIRISNRFGSKVISMERWVDLFWPGGLPVPPEEMSGIIDREIGEGL